MRKRLGGVLAAVSLLGALSCADAQVPAAPLDYDAIAARLPAREATGRISDRVPDIEVANQHGEALRFFEDLVRDRRVVVNFMYTTCAKICPGTTSNLVRLHEALGGRVGRDVHFVSVSLDPEVDTPEMLHRYWEAFGSHPGWHYLTGRYDEIELLRRRLGVYDLDPVIDADKTEHGGILTIGNDVDDRWIALPALSTVTDLADAVLRFGRGNGRFASRAARPPAPKQVELEAWPGRGRVESIADDRRSLVVAHEDIEGLMPAMTMRFDVSSEDLLEGLSAGEEIGFSVVRTDRSYRIVSLERGDAP